MKLEINGDPGTGNSYTEVNIGNIENNFPAVKKVVIIQGPDGKRMEIEGGDEVGNNPGSNADTELCKEDKRKLILEKYVGKTLQFVQFNWQDKYMELWNDILDLPAVDAVIYNRGQQHGTSFNRKELCHIICYLGCYVNGGIGIYEKYVRSRFANAFADGWEKATRPELGFSPSQAIQAAIDKLLQNKKYTSKPKK